MGADEITPRCDGAFDAYNLAGAFAIDDKHHLFTDLRVEKYTRERWIIR